VGFIKPINFPSHQINEELARRINQEARANPKSPYVGKFVAIASGKVIFATDDLEEFGRRLDQLGIDPKELLCLEACRDYDKVEVHCLRPDWLTWDPNIGRNMGPITPEGLNMPVPGASRQLNEELARRINLEARTNPQSPYVGKFVCIRNGQVLFVADDHDDLDRRLDLLTCDPSELFCVEASRDYDKVEYIW